MSKILTFLSLILVFVALFSLTGCIFSPDDDTGPPPVDDPVEYPFPDTKEQLLDNYKLAYQEMDVDGYIDCLHDDFTFVFLEAEAGGIGVPSGSWGYAVDYEVMTRFFSGDSYQGADVLVPGVQSISFSNWEMAGIWNDEAPNHPYFANSKRGLYNIYMYITMVGGVQTYTVNTRQNFFLTSEEEEQEDGTTRTRWYIRGQEDLGAIPE
jgi:hypothetical protein